MAQGVPVAIWHSVGTLLDSVGTLLDSVGTLLDSVGTLLDSVGTVTKGFSRDSFGFSRDRTIRLSTELKEPIQEILYGFKFYTLSY